MFSSLKIGMLGLSLGAGALLAGCESGGAQPSGSHVMSMQAVQCDKCQTTMVYTPTTVGGGQGGSVTTYSARSKEMDCPDCKSGATTYFASGQLQPACKACGGNMKTCDAH